MLIGSWSGPVLEASDLAARIHVIDHWALDRSNKSTFANSSNTSCAAFPWSRAQAVSVRYVDRYICVVSFVTRHNMERFYSPPCRLHQRGTRSMSHRSIRLVSGRQAYAGIISSGCWSRS